MFDDKIFKNIIESNTVFDFSLTLKNNENFYFFYYQVIIMIKFIIF